MRTEKRIIRLYTYTGTIDVYEDCGYIIIKSRDETIKLEYADAKELVTVLQGLLDD